jgi:polar amino acid transport system substrate-binding protein
MKILVKFWTGILFGLIVSSTIHAGDVLDQINATKTLKVATNANWPPQSFINENNELDGFDVDVAREIAKRMKLELKLVTPNWDIVTAGNWYGRWDMHIGSMTPTQKRAEVLAFPAVYYYTPAGVAVHQDSTVSSINQLNGKRIGIGYGTTYELYLQKDLTIDAKGAPAFSYLIDSPKIKTYETGTLALDDLRLGDGLRLEAVLSSIPSILGAIENGYPIKLVGSPIFYEPLAVTTDLGDLEFGGKLEDIIGAMRADGTLSTLSKKWYGVDYSTTR